jgi:ligand-binding sensor domain-containing protein/two-component sensor histidine kinase
MTFDLRNADSFRNSDFGSRDSDFSPHLNRPHVLAWLTFSVSRFTFHVLRSAESMPAVRLLLTLALFGAACVLSAPAALREPVHPRRNVEEFAPVEAKFVRFTIRATNRGEPCLDEFEIYAAEGESRNVALAANGARATASGSLPGYAIHELAGVNDGHYGNGRSWIADRVEGAWVQIELPQNTSINKIVWGRDREGRFIDRLSTQYEIAVAVDPNSWRTVASSDGREALTVGAQLSGVPSLTRSFVNRFAPVGTTLSPDAERASTEYRIDVWQTSDGLPGNAVTSIKQTADGYLWIGTLNGLARFDGVRFKIFGEGSGLPNGRVLCLLAARDDTLWIGTDGGGLASYRDGTFRVLTTKDGLSSDTVLALAEDAAGRIRVGTAEGLSTWANGKFVDDTTLASARGQPVSALTIDRDGGLWALVGAELRVRQGTNSLRRMETPEPSAFSSVLTAHAGLSGQVWFGGANGYVGAVSNRLVHVFGEQPGQLLDAIWDVCETRGGDVWAGTASGGLRRLRAGRFTSLTTQEGLSDNSVRCVFEDREGNLWVGTVGGGLNRLKPRKLTTFTTRDGLAHNVIMSLAEDAEGTLWVGSNCGGLTARRNGVFAPFHANYLLDNECIWSLLPARDGSLWIGTWGGGLFRMQGREVKNFSIARSGNDEPVVALCENREGGLWVGAMQGGLKVFDRDQVREFTTNGLPTQPVTALLQEADGRLWIGTSGGGLYQFDGGQFTALTRTDGLPSDFIRTLYRDQKRVLWIGTGGGLARLAEGSIRAFTRAQGLPDDVISQILEDDRGNFWFGCNQGIFRVARRELETVAAGRAPRVNPISYGRAEGMESLECTGGFHPAGLKTRDGKLWFSTVKGLVMVDPERISVNERPPVVQLEAIVVDGVAQSQISDLKSEIKLGPGVQRVEFHYTALSLVASERNRFKHRLEGLERDWVEAGTQRVATYPRLPAGRYTFRVIAANNDGVWNETGAAFRFTVLPAFWQTWWFIALAGVLVLGGGGWLVRYDSVRRLRRKLHRLQEKHALEKERTRIAQDIHDELGASLTRIALLTELGHKHRDQPDEVSADLGKISVTARDAVRAMDAIVWAVNPRNDSLDHFANYVSQFAEDFFRLTPIRCRLDVPADLPEQPLPTEARHQLFLAVKESLNNVVRHSGAGEVWLRMHCDHGELRIVIEDNGRGLPATAPGTGQDGLANIRTRAERLGGRLEIESGQGRGTLLRLILPLTARSHS